MKLYFGNTVTTVTTIMILVLLGFIGESIANRTNINYWGRRSLFLLAYGLTICCFAAARDGLDNCGYLYLWKIDTFRSIQSSSCGRKDSRTYENRVCHSETTDTKQGTGHSKVCSP